MICFQQLNRLSRSADVVVAISRYRFVLQRVFLLKTAKRQRFNKLERRRGVHCFVSADGVFSRYFVEEVQQLLSLFVEVCDTTAFGLVGTTAFGLVGTTAFGLIQQKRSFCQTSRCSTYCYSADAPLGVYSADVFQDKQNGVT
ncbi:DEAD (Asp-Glu-Ala-Asp) box polypeptide 3, Putative [Dorcoceras hygrometricum]|uniref:DEAD (Asp-Glu-Ala-Asp) box polypeptide 3, Putative n=1 Tax=Dorcoceras hygrometricum TaxID=472368 RepID=A0A2Z7C060_9LAMI|nr:DEAD (Asp-Glu-Ala-Asp) box polypeptide 3, Putative [Dorcoceras hygrometricum]